MKKAIGQTVLDLGSGAKADDNSQDGRSTGKSLDRKYSGKSFGTPTCEDDVGATSSLYVERDEESLLAYASKASYPVGAIPTSAITAAVPPPPHVSQPTSAQSTAEHNSKDFQRFYEFDARAAPTTDVPAPAASAMEIEILGSLSFSLNSLAVVPASPPATTPEANASANFHSGPIAVAATSAPTINNQPFDDPFGDGMLQDVPLTFIVPIQQQITAPSNSFKTNSDQLLDVPLQCPQNSATGFGGGVDATYMISAKTNPLADMGLDSDAALTYTVTMGKAMISGSGKGHVRRHESAWAWRGRNFVAGGPGSNPGMALRAMGINIHGIDMSMYMKRRKVGMVRGMNMPGNNMGQGMHMQRRQMGGVPSGSTTPGGCNYMKGAEDYAKTNPLADMGLDSDAISLREKRTTSALTYTVTMGKAMRSGSDKGHVRRHKSAWAWRGRKSVASGSGSNPGMALRAMGINLHGIDMSMYMKRPRVGMGRV